MRKVLYIISCFIAFNATYFTCSAQTSVLSGDNYDKKTDKTTLILIPYGNITFPGKWTQVSYSKSSRQYWFRRNSDSAMVGITKNPKEKYSFYKKGMSGVDFVNEFYKWDSAYWENQGFKVEKLRQDTANKFIVWKVLNKNVEDVFLYGFKKGLAYNLMVSKMKTTVDGKMDFVEKLYTDN